jgi:hypothetical protein
MLGWFSTLKLEVISSHVNRRFGWFSLATCISLVHCSADFQHWRWRWYVPPTHRFTCCLHGAIYQKMEIFIQPNILPFRTDPCVHSLRCSAQLKHTTKWDFKGKKLRIWLPDKNEENGPRTRTYFDMYVTVQLKEKNQLFHFHIHFRKQVRQAVTHWEMLLPISATLPHVNKLQAPITFIFSQTFLRCHGITVFLGWG